MKKLLVLMALTLVAGLMTLSGVSATHSPLAARWHLNEPIAGADSSDHGNDGTVIGATLVPGLFGEALSFDGVSDYVNVPDDPSLDLTTAITIEGWVYLTARRTGGNGYLVAKQLAFLVIAENDNQFDNTVSAAINFPASHLNSGVTLPLNQWSHLALTYDSEDESDFAMVLYIDGVEKAHGVAVGPIDTNNHLLRIGCYTNSGAACSASHNFTGLIDEVRIWGCALTAKEIARHARSNSSAASSCRH
ncbi:MAG: LamG domain-containing protein [Chloroflexi bacterium]|nr:LamG domain-containing protein [Chloroflexota bacterium]